ncbi:conserved hypothetical protein [Candidatus Desulfarcum epimagneticum]|uniref:Uncharacterized protein n=1 Tax=uncultured Desulfobacteraceae bacterium TaxID=218296 RepID=A0A484HF05_9BACT|nr:conserved hypothetical protein [uncultured Desulfobacteraceae bacterium]
MSCKFFPFDPSGDPRSATAFNNPAMQLFGNRFFSDQTRSELLVEFLLVVFSNKKIGSGGEFVSCLPEMSDLMAWSNEKLAYSPKARLNLKLFSLLGASKLDSRHKTHREHHQALIQELEDRIDMDGNGDKDSITRTLENLFLGFQGAGSGRTWCAQSFIPLSDGLLSRETIWKESKARVKSVDSWEELFPSKNSNKYFDMTQHVFLARGGEVLFLQLCNALRQPKSKIKAWGATSDLGFSQEELDPGWLHKALEDEFERFKSHCPSALTRIAEFIDEKLDPDTPEKTDGPEDDRRFINAGWCRTESWQEGYVFAVEIYRLLRAGLDIVDRIHLLEIACALQVLRSLAVQSERLLNPKDSDGKIKYRLAISAPVDNRPAIRRLSQLSVKNIEKQIYQALRNGDAALPENEGKKLRILNQADKSYGGKLFISLSKKLGFIIPRLGPGARFVINQQILRFLVITNIPLGGRLTLDSFKEKIESRHGMVFDADGMDRASQWLTGTGLYLPADTDYWLQEMLEAAGFLIQLSDSCALVSNPADDINKEV